MSENCELRRGLRRREKNATDEGAGHFEKPAPDARAAPPEAHESLISRETVAEVLLTGLFFVGWAPQRFEPFEGGFAGMKTTPQLAHQGCENCHGPAAAHTAVERGDVRASTAERDRLRQELVLTLATPEGKQKAVNNCLECHDLDNSPQFDFDEYWPQVEHNDPEEGVAPQAEPTTASTAP